MPKKYTVLHIYFHFEPMGRKRKELDLNSYVGRFALRLRTLREGRDLTVEDVAKKIGVTATTIYDWEAGGHTPPVEKLPLLADALDTPIRMLLPEK